MSNLNEALLTAIFDVKGDEYYPEHEEVYKNVQDVLLGIVEKLPSWSVTGHVGEYGSVTFRLRKKLGLFATVVAVNQFLPNDWVTDVLKAANEYDTD